MTLRKADRQGNLFDDVVRFLDEALPQTSIINGQRRRSLDYQSSAAQYAAAAVQ